MKFLILTLILFTSSLLAFDNANLSALGLTYNFNKTGTFFYYDERNLTDQYQIKFMVESLFPTYLRHAFLKGKELVDDSYAAEDIFEPKKGAIYEHIFLKVPITKKVDEWELGIFPSGSFSIVSARTHNGEFENFKTVSTGVGLVYIMNWNYYLRTSVSAGGEALFIKSYADRVNYRGKLEIATKVVLNEYVGFYISTGANGIKMYEPGATIGTYKGSNYFSPIIKLGLMKPFIKN